MGKENKFISGNGKEIFITEKTRTHLWAHPDVWEFLEEAVSKIKIPDGADYFCEAVKFGKIIGVSSLVETSPISLGEETDFALRLERQWPSRVALDSRKEPCDAMTLEIKFEKLSGKYILSTAYIGYPCPYEPGYIKNQGSDEFKKALYFWCRHSLAYDAKIMKKPFRSSWGSILNNPAYNKNMKILILHGIGGQAGIHWQKWFHDQLVEGGNEVIMPDLPDSRKPDRKKWLKAAEESIKDVDLKNLVIVGHSLGVTTALDLIENMSVKALISVSGFSDDYGAELNSYFLGEKKMDLEKVKRNLDQAFIIFGDDDPYVPQKYLESLADELGVDPEIIPRGGHLNTDSGFTNFPRLLEIIQNEIK